MDSPFARANRCVSATLVFLVILAIFPLTPKPAGDIKILIYELFAFVMLALWLFTPRRTRGKGDCSSALVPFFIAYLAFNVVAAFYSINMGYSFGRELVKTTALFILFLAASDADQTARQVWALVSVICVAVSLAALYGIVQYMGLDPFPWGETAGTIREAPATFGNPDLAAHTIMPTIIFAVGLFSQRKGRWAILCIPLLAVVLTLNQSRTTMVALAGALYLVLVARWASQRVRKLSGSIVWTFGVLLGTGLTGIALYTAMTQVTTGQPYSDDASLTTRYNSYYGATRMIQDRPWVGYGPGMYRVKSPEYWTPFEQERFANLNMRSAYVHSEPLEIAAEAGLPAAIMCVSILILGIYYGLSMGLGSGDSDRRALGMTMAAFFFAFFFDSLFGFSLHAPATAVLFFLIAGTTAGVWREGQAPIVRRAFRYEWFPVAGRLMVLGCALIIPILGIRDFSAQFFHQRGRGALQFEAHAEATKSFTKAASLAPYDWLHPYFLGQTAAEMNRPDEEARQYARTLDLHPNFIYARTRRAQTLINMASSTSDEEALAFLEEAVGEAEYAIRIVPRLPEAHDLLGKAFLFQSNWRMGANPEETQARRSDARREAEEHLLTAIEYGSDIKEDLLHLLARSRLTRDDAYGAQDALMDALALNPETPKTWTLLLKSSEHLRQSGEGSSGFDTTMDSIDWCIKRLSRTENDGNALVAMSLLQADILIAVYKDEAGAEKAFQQVALAYPARIEVWAQYHSFAKSNGRGEAVSAILAQAIAGRGNAGENIPEVIQAVAVGLEENTNGIVEGVSRFARAVQHHQESGANPATVAANHSWAADMLAAQAQQVPLPPEDARVVYSQLGFLYEIFQNFDMAAQMFGQELSFETDQNRRRSIQQKIDTVRQKLNALPE